MAMGVLGLLSAMRRRVDESMRSGGGKRMIP
jgi:hypothetical protein